MSIYHFQKALIIMGWAKCGLGANIDQDGDISILVDVYIALSSH